MYILSMWAGHRAKESILQAQYLLWSVGSTLTPILVKPFLVEEAVNNTMCNENARVNTEEQWSDVTNTSQNHDNEDVCDSDRDITTIRYAYSLIGGIFLVIVFFYVGLYFLLGRHLYQQENFSSQSSQSTSQRNHGQRRGYRFGFFILVFIFGFCVDSSEGIGYSYLSLFVVSGIGWTVQKGASVTAAFWGAFAAGRLVAIPTSYLIPPKIMLLVSIILTCIGYTIFIFVHFIDDIAIFAGAMIAGFGVSTIFPYMLLWASSVLQSTSKVSAIALTASHVGAMVSFPMIGALIENFGPMCYVYLVVTATYMLLVLFIIMHFCSKASLASETHEYNVEMINPFEKDNGK